ncbi:MAG: methyl-accepting chemotaxis protein [Synechocystis sp.]|nr:methyl-accepting chemotaxis protein [Synechocystis sp.]
MASETNFSQLYGLAYAAYGQGDYQEASSHIDQLASEFPDEPNVLLLKGHINIGLERYDLAQQAYQAVIQISDRQDLIECAQQAIQQISGHGDMGGNNAHQTADVDAFGSQWDGGTGQDWDPDDDAMDWDSGVFTDEDFGEPTLGHGGQDPSASQSASPFGGAVPPSGSNDAGHAGEAFASDPFAAPADAKQGVSWGDIDDVDWNADDFADNLGGDEPTMMPETGESTFVVPPEFGGQALDFAELASEIDPEPLGNPMAGSAPPDYQSWQGGDGKDGVDSLIEHDNVPTVQSSPEGYYGGNPSSQDNDVMPTFEAFEDGGVDDLSDFDLTDIAPELPDSSLFTQNTSLDLTAGDPSSNVSGVDSLPTAATGTPPGMATWLKPEGGGAGDLSGPSSPFSDRPTSEVDPGWLGWFTNASLFKKQIYMAIASGVFSGLAVLIIGGVTGVGANKTTPAASPPPAASQDQEKKAEESKPDAKSAQDKPAETQSKEKEGKPAANSADTAKASGPSLLNLAFLTALTSAIGVFFINRLLMRQIKNIIDDLQSQFESIYEGNFNVRAKVRSEDELGALTQRFNYISQVILTATSEAQERAAATEKVREKLQRQVIRLLDDVEGASRGDLTVQAEVTADELGAVADAFNLTIQNLREIVLQVKNAAKQVNNNCKDSESFARNNSSDALRMAEELAVTLNSVQLMTESIERVAENAREAEEVAHTSSLTALKGGEAVERTVGGILQIRETVSETARKVKRLAEASQEISKIVAVISQIASRTNLLALNASIQAARAGEAGRGFAIVADEVRQLADRSAKSLKEIEQIVLQIQSETGSVMTAMEEGIQQVIDVTDKSEQSKRALEDIIEVSNRINTLVRSITADTVKQQENSGAVSNVMQSIELTAQETSQESQRVAGSLQTLVSISRDLLTSVERFRVERNAKN